MDFEENTDRLCQDGKKSPAPIKFVSLRYTKEFLKKNNLTAIIKGH